MPLRLSTTTAWPVGRLSASEHKPRTLCRERVWLFVKERTSRCRGSEFDPRFSVENFTITPCWVACRLQGLEEIKSTFINLLLATYSLSFNRLQFTYLTEQAFRPIQHFTHVVTQNIVLHYRLTVRRVKFKYEQRQLYGTGIGAIQSIRTLKHKKISFRRVRVDGYGEPSMSPFFAYLPPRTSLYLNQFIDMSKLY